MPTEDLTVSWQQPQFIVDLTPVDVTLQFNAAGAGPMGPPGAMGEQGQQGNPGVAGPPGSQGLPGGIGPSGPQGPPGPQGIQGSTGSAGATGSTGPAGATGQGYHWAGVWSAATAYNPYDTVSRNGSSYVCILASTGNDPATDSTHWSIIAQIGATGPQGTTGPQGSPGPPGGASAYTTLSAAFTMPAVNSSAVASVANAAAFSVGNIVYVSPIGYLNVLAVNSGANQLTLQNLGYAVNQAQGSSAPSGSTVTGVGPQGPPGPQGIQGSTGSAGATGSTGPAGSQGATGPAGSQGVPGTAATISVGTTTTGSPGTAAAVNNSGTSSAAVFNFQIPAGQTGAPGAVGGIGPQGPPGPGDMTKAVYDTNNDGIVDHAALANTATTASAVPWTGITGAPASFSPSAHAATHNLGGSDAIAPDWTQVQNKPGQFLAQPHAASHVTGGSDIIAPASAATVGLLNKLSGNTTDFVDGTNTCQNLVAAVQPTIWSARLRSFNAIGNPTFEVDQRNVGNTVTVSNGLYVIDRWGTNIVGTMTATAGQLTPALGLLAVPGTNFLISQKMFRVTIGTAQTTLGASDQLGITQNIEGPFLRELINDVHSVSLFVRSSVAISFGLSIRDSTSSRSLVSLCTIPTPNVFTLIQIPNLPVFPAAGSFPLSPGGIGYTLRITLAAGSTLTTPANGTWQTGNYLGAVGQGNLAATAGASFDIAFIQHEPGPLCTTLIDKPFTGANGNYEECLRYFTKSYLYGTALGAVTNTGMVYGPALANTAPSVYVPFKKTMAKTPTMNAWSSVTGTVNSVRDQGAAIDKGITGFTGVGDAGFSGMSVSSPNTSNWFYMFHYTADTGW